uniref:Uncharacterized protein n=1 Tax=Arundo donax TaxID=35708 RepID=A0A0A8ZU27_ARUDO
MQRVDFFIPQIVHTRA